MPTERLVIVSDSHLGAAARDVETAFLAFLDEVPSLGDALLINGDLFAFWFAYKRAIPRAGLPVVTRLAALARRMPVAMTGGNHDRWGDTFWEPDLGIRFSRDELRLPFGRGVVSAIHGDGLAEAHWRGRMIHRITRHPISSLAYRLLHPDLGFWLMERFGARIADSTRDAGVIDEAAARQRAWAEQRLRDAPEISLLVLGHTHRAVVEEMFPGRWYLNPGAWVEGLRYAVATEETVELKQYRG